VNRPNDLFFQKNLKPERLTPTYCASRTIKKPDERKKLKNVTRVFGGETFSVGGVQ